MILFAQLACAALVAAVVIMVMVALVQHRQDT